MSKVDRRKPRRSTASESRYTLFEFERDFPDDDACLEYLFARRFPDGVFCPTHKKVTTHYRQQGQPSWVCSCGHKVHPTAGTIFENSATSLQLWFYAMYLMASTRCGISAKQIERELGVTYKTAWRMFNRIRSVLGQDGGFMTGRVEIDETFIGGKAKWKSRGKKLGQGGGTVGKTPVQGFAERGKRGSKIVANIVSDVGSGTLIPAVYQRVLPGTHVYTDEWQGYKNLGRKGYRHTRVHHTEHIYVVDDAHTNSLEGFWSLLKRGISGVYHGVSTKHLQAYVDEYVFRYNNRGSDMFESFMTRVIRDAAMRA